MPDHSKRREERTVLKNCRDCAHYLSCDYAEEWKSPCVCMEENPVRKRRRKTMKEEKTNAEIH